MMSRLLDVDDKTRLFRSLCSGADNEKERTTSKEA